MTIHRSIRFLLLAAGAAILSACGPDDPIIPGTNDTDGVDTDLTEPPPETEDTAFSLADSGSLMLYRKTHPDGTKKTELLGLFVDEAPPFTNLAHCAVVGGPCIEVLPTDDDTWVEFDRERRFDPLFSDYRYVGHAVSLGPWSAPYINTPDMSYYYRDLTRELRGAEIRGDFGVTFGVQWGDYQGTRDIRVSSDIEVYHPVPNSHMRVRDGQVVPIRWTPNGEGDIYLTIQGGKLFARIYLLEDDGYYDLDIDELQLGIDPVELEFSLSRWNRSTVTHRGNTLHVTATSEVVWTGDFVFTGGRDDIVAADKCNDARNLPRLLPGHYWGELNKGEFFDDIQGMGCVVQPPGGRDAIARVVIPTNSALAATYDLRRADGSLYLLEDCGNANSCLAGADADEALPEFLQYFNDTGADKEAFLVMDAATPELGMEDRIQYTLDLDIITLQEPNLYDLCYDAQNQNPPTGAGVYWTDQVAYRADMNPGRSGCTASDLWGNEAITKITLLANETLTVEVEMVAGGDPGIYLLSNCTQVTSCKVGSDGDLGAKESFQYKNESAGSENLYLVIDSKAGLQPFRLTVAITQ